MVIFSLGQCMSQNKGQSKNKTTNYQKSIIKTKFCTSVLCLKFISTHFHYFFKQNHPSSPPVFLSDDIKRASIGKEANKKELVLNTVPFIFKN